jgi:hypothetical protein
MMVAMMVEQSHLTFDRKSNAIGCQPEKRQSSGGFQADVSSTGC